MKATGIFSIAISEYFTIDFYDFTFLVFFIFIYAKLDKLIIIWTNYAILHKIASAIILDRFITSN